MRNSKKAFASFSTINSIFAGSNRCDVCGRFISWADFQSDAATCIMISPDSDYSSEDYETLCKNHANKESL